MEKTEESLEGRWQGLDSMSDYPTRLARVDDKGWVLDKEGNYLRIPGHENEALGTDDSGWMYGAAPKPEKPEPKKPERWEWPVANDEPDPNSYYYAERNPTRFSWPGNRDDVEKWARYLVENYNVSVNTYHHHPEEVWIKYGVSREYDSFDVWGPGGRGDPIDPALGDEIFSLLFYDKGKPDIEWIIWRATMYGAWNGWQGEPFGTDDFSWHMDHIHVTYL